MIQFIKFLSQISNLNVRFQVFFERLFKRIISKGSAAAPCEIQIMKYIIYSSWVLIPVYLIDVMSCLTFKYWTPSPSPSLILKDGGGEFYRIYSPAENCNPEGPYPSPFPNP